MKNALALGPLHQELERAALELNGTGSSNILLAKVSFDCEMKTKAGEVFRKYIHFDLKIPGLDNDQHQGVLSYNFLEQLHGSKKKVYELIEAFYKSGRREVNRADEQHGIQPLYDGTKPAHDQYIRHTEQMLVAYLASEEGAQMLLNRLRATIRGNHQEVQAVKVYNIGLHLHSTKTCCAPCEYSLIGLMTPTAVFTDQVKDYSLISNFQRLGRAPNEQLQFSFPRRSLFRVIVTVTATENDSVHKTQPNYTQTPLAAGALPEYAISVKDPGVSKKIFTSMLNSGFDRRKMATAAHLQDKTVAISGSLATAGSPRTARATSQAKEEEEEAVAGLIRDFATLAGC